MWYLKNDFTNFDEIWHNDATLSSVLHLPIKIEVSKSKLVVNAIMTRNPAVAGMADRTAPVVKLTRQKIVIPSGIGLAAVNSWQLDTCASVYKLW